VPGARDATQHLLTLGHRRIAVITGPRGWIATEERLLGYHAALATAGVMPEAAIEIESDFNRSGGYASGSRLFDVKHPPTALFAFNDNLAVGAIQAARERGLRVPEDLSVIGFDDSDEASLLTPALTSVRQPLAEMGRMAVVLLTRLLDGLPVDALAVELATKLVVRESTARTFPLP
jgi:LacI family transcriptional regulator